MKPLDWFVAAFGAAVADVREKLVEEPWFGRAVDAPTPTPSLAEALGWTEQPMQARRRSSPRSTTDIDIEVNCTYVDARTIDIDIQR